MYKVAKKKQMKRIKRKRIGENKPKWQNSIHNFFFFKSV